MDPDETAFVEALTADPTDVTRRLVFADWLMDRDRPVESALQRVLAEPHEDAHRLDYAALYQRHGAPGFYGVTQRIARQIGNGAITNEPELRADHIRADVEIEALRLRGCPAVYDPDEPNAPQRLQALRHRRGEITSGFSIGDWFHDRKAGPSNRKVGPDTWECHHTHRVAFSRPRALLIRRGFVWAVRCPAAYWARHGDQLRAQQPITDVYLLTPPRLSVGVDVSNPGAPVWWLRDAVEPGPTFREVSVAGPGGNALVAGLNGIRAFLKRRWPGLRTHLPSDLFAMRPERVHEAIVQGEDFRRPYNTVTPHWTLFTGDKDEVVQLTE